MAVELADYGPKPHLPADAELRAAAVRIADQIAAEHPHPLDDEMPRIAGAVIAKDPKVRGDVRDLLDQLGIKTDQIRRPS